MRKRIHLFMNLLLCIGFSLNAQIDLRPQDTEIWEPEPVKVIPGTGTQAPTDAIILFDGGDLSQWKSQDNGEARWISGKEGMTIVPGTGAIFTTIPFGDCQLHIEWKTPEKITGKGQGRGNSGIFFMQKYEVQVLDSYNNRTYSNGQAGSVYKQHIPLVNACMPPGEWQTYDIIFTAPVFSKNKKLIKPAFLTVIHNGILIQNHVELKGETVFIGDPSYKFHDKKLPLMLQDHGNPVSYRNIWIREL